MTDASMTDGPHEPATLMAADDRWWDRRDLGRAAAYAAVELVALAFTWPVSEMPYDDDDSYAVTARTLAEKGHLQFNGWATAAVVVVAAEATVRWFTPYPYAVPESPIPVSAFR